MKIFLASALALMISTAAMAQAPTQQNGRWQIADETTPLTGARFLSAAIESNNQIANMLGYPARASLVVRCGEGGMAVYLNWPQVVSHDGQNFLGQPKTMAVWRIDDGKMQGNLWDIDNTGTAAGEFKSKNAAKLLSTFVRARKTGRASFRTAAAGCRVRPDRYRSDCGQHGCGLRDEIEIDWERYPALPPSIQAHRCSLCAKSRAAMSAPLLSGPTAGIHWASFASSFIARTR